MDQNLLPPDEFRGRVIDLAGDGGAGDHQLLWVIFALLLIVLVVTLASLVLGEYRGRQAHRPDVPDDGSATDVHETPPQMDVPSSGGDALAILDARYAAGEVVRRDYLRIRQDILGPNAVPS